MLPISSLPLLIFNSEKIKIILSCPKSTSLKVFNTYPSSSSTMAQKPIPTPAAPAMNWSDRLSLTEKHLPQLKSLPAPPVGFEPLKATNDELIAAGLPRRPDPEKQPGLYAKWTSVMSRPLTFVPTKYSLITTPRDALLRGLKPVVDQAGPSANSTSTNWSGAVDMSLGAGDSYVTVSGSWTVPNAYPPDSAKLATGGWKDGTYLCVSWVGSKRFFVPFSFFTKFLDNPHSLNYVHDMKLSLE
jgi:hypothetical protein